MSNPKLITLLYRLHERSASGDVPWEETERDGVYQVSFSQNTLRLYCRPSKQYPGEKEYVLAVHNSLGTEIAEITDESTRNEIGDSFLIFRGLHEMAAGKALGVDETLDSILDDLDTPDF